MRSASGWARSLQFPLSVERDPYNVIRRLGHSSITTTFNRYGHLFPERDEAITAGLEGAYREAQGKGAREADVVELR